MAPIKNLAWAMFLAADFAAAHSAITNAVGNAGGSGMGLGVDTSTPRDGTRRRPFQTDSTRFRGDAADTVGETLAGGDNQIEQGTVDIMEETGDELPQVTPGGSLEMTIHQVNSDGAGPYTCMINSDGTATSWENIPVTTNVEGNDRGRNRDGEMGDFPLVASIPQDQTCSGSVAGEENVCLVRCENPARAGPFGGVVPVQMAQVNNNNDNNGNGNANNNNNNNNNGNVNDNNNGNVNNDNTGNGNVNNGNVNNDNTGNGNVNNDNTGNGNVNNDNTGNGNVNNDNTNNANDNTGNNGNVNNNNNNGNVDNTGNSGNGNVDNTDNNGNTGNGNVDNTDNTGNTGNGNVDNTAGDSNGNGNVVDDSQQVGNEIIRRAASPRALKSRPISFRL